MEKNRLEAFSDGVLAIVITIMVLELKVPHGDSFETLVPLVPVFLSYVLSFVYLGIYWNNHHHMVSTVARSTGPIMWANLHLLFWLSLIPFATGWVGENHFTSTPSALYGVILFMCAAAYKLLQHVIIKAQGPDSLLRRAVGADTKGRASTILYACGFGLSFVEGWLGMVIYAGVAVLWCVPDRRVARLFEAESGAERRP